MRAKFLKTFSLNGTFYPKGAEAVFDKATFKALEARGVVEEAKESENKTKRSGK